MTEDGKGDAPRETLHYFDGELIGGAQTHRPDCQGCKLDAVLAEVERLTRENRYLDRRLDEWRARWTRSEEQLSSACERLDELHQHFPALKIRAETAEALVERLTGERDEWKEAALRGGTYRIMLKESQAEVGRLSGLVAPLAPQVAASRNSLSKIGDGDWTPQDTEHSRLCTLAEAALAALREDGEAG